MIATTRTPGLKTYHATYPWAAGTPLPARLIRTTRRTRPATREWRVSRGPGPIAHPGCRPSGGGQVAALGVVVTAQPVDDADDAGRVVEVAPPLDGADDPSPDGGRRVRRRREHATFECSPFQLPGDERRLDLAGGSEPYSGAGTRLAASDLEFRGRP